ncbi:MAG TPA: primase C-terminal domain-containing protein [candidate division Zixibacteria bacterium]|nr:primase C-terminal domain-containing protein [candidate division Zixibacteria bacterium]
MRKFRWVDFAAHFQKGFRNHIVSIDEVPALVQAFDRYGCYATYFFFSDEVLAYMSAQAEAGSPTISGYGGKVWAPFFPIDLDHPETQPALEAARLLAAFLRNGWKIAPEALQIYFSGSKGFHLMLDTRIFGRVAPSKTLPAVFDAVRRHLSYQLPERLRDTVDFAIKDRVRLLRLPNTIHERSGLNKVLLFPEEIERLDAAAVRELARGTRPLACTDETGLISRVHVGENEEASRLFRRVRQQVARLKRRPFSYRFRRQTDSREVRFRCAAVERIWESHIEPGFRNNCAIRLASELRLLGLSADETLEKLFEWNEKNRIALPRDELERVVRSAYHHPFPYRYSCRDEILRRFCPLPDYESCREFTASRSETD